MKFKVQLIKHEEGFTILCPDLPGCISEGDTEEEALENIKDAIEGYLDVMIKNLSRRHKEERPDVVALEKELPFGFFRHHA